MSLTLNMLNWWEYSGDGPLAMNLSDHISSHKATNKIAAAGTKLKKL